MTRLPPVLLTNLRQFLSHPTDRDRRINLTLPESIDGLILQLIKVLRSHRCLLVLDNVESILQSGQLAGQYCQGYEWYGELLRRVGLERAWI